MISKRQVEGELGHVVQIDLNVMLNLSLFFWNRHWTRAGQLLAIVPSNNPRSLCVKPILSLYHVIMCWCSDELHLGTVLGDKF